MARLRGLVTGPLAEALARFHAAAFAEFTYRLLCRLGEASAGDVLPDGLTEDEEATLETAPPWIREAYERAKNSTERGLSQEEAAAFIARDRLMRALGERKMTQADLARQLGKSSTVISRIFKAPHRSRVTTLQAIAQALGVELADILAPREH
jgi:DNA-binding Xre family transcriptional regulator